MLHLLVVFRTSNRQARYDHRFQNEGLRENIYFLDNEVRRANSGDAVDSRASSNMLTGGAIAPAVEQIAPPPPPVTMICPPPPVKD